MTLKQANGKERYEQKCHCYHPSMPCEAPGEDAVLQRMHRVNSPVTTFGVPACVARPVGNKEIASQPKAREVAVKEWKRLWDKDVWECYYRA